MKNKNLLNNTWILALVLIAVSVIISILFSLMFGYHKALSFSSLILASFLVGYLHTAKHKAIMEKSMRLKISLIVVGCQLAVGLILGLAFGLPELLIGTKAAVSILVIVGVLLISFFTGLIIYACLG